ncbi:hypothetical protein DLAC_00897 [Tieghemostelium lacteum]|uniref:Uncharacterized protein n=1 Tax=Tieghemostelium lacteum TaxID=361077 RepID=A0A152A7R7_TIELA|nr:hypothetical protein DLAC_00897 [Tieghemostelium lacteum]|eukprot:KYR02097.1 hypothetical protein DLAC_00897 [Tieghemostelium lacteum]
MKLRIVVKASPNKDTQSFIKIARYHQFDYHMVALVDSQISEWINQKNKLYIDNLKVIRITKAHYVSLIDKLPNLETLKVSLTVKRGVHDVYEYKHINWRTLFPRKKVIDFECSYTETPPFYIQEFTMVYQFNKVILRNGLLKIDKIESLSSLSPSSTMITVLQIMSLQIDYQVIESLIKKSPNLKKLELIDVNSPIDYNINNQLIDLLLQQPLSSLVKLNFINRTLAVQFSSLIMLYNRLKVTEMHSFFPKFVFDTRKDLSKFKIENSTIQHTSFYSSSDVDEPNFNHNLLVNWTDFKNLNSILYRDSKLKYLSGIISQNLYNLSTITIQPNIGEIKVDMQDILDSLKFNYYLTTLDFYYLDFNHLDEFLTSNHPTIVNLMVSIVETKNCDNISQKIITAIKSNSNLLKLSIRDFTEIRGYFFDLMVMGIYENGHQIRYLSIPCSSLSKSFKIDSFEEILMNNPHITYLNGCKTPNTEYKRLLNKYSVMPI